MGTEMKGEGPLKVEERGVPSGEQSPVGMGEESLPIGVTGKRSKASCRQHGNGRSGVDLGKH